MNSTEDISAQLHPLNDCLLVELEQKHKQFATREGRYDSRTEGIVVAIANDDAVYWKHDRIAFRLKDLLGCRVHFEEFKEGSRIERGGKLYSFIKIEDIRGWEEV